MILLDPELEPPPAGALVATRKTPLNKMQTPAGADRVPTARTLARFLAEAQAAVRLRGEVNVLLTSDSAIRRLNRQFRGKNKATDVLSFPAAETIAKHVAGDLAISVETARVQAGEHGHSLAKEIKILILHGLLHLAGYDHESDSGQMARREQTLRRRLRLPDGLIERATPAEPKPTAKRGSPKAKRSTTAKRRGGRP